MLEEFRDDVSLLVTEARVGGTRIDLELLEKVFVVDCGVGHYPQKLKYRFRPRHFYMDEVKYCRRVWRVK